MATAAVMAVGVAASAYSAHKNREAAKKASKRQAKTDDKQNKLGEERLEFGKQQYNDWKEHFEPVIDAAKKKAMQSQHPNYDAVTADASHAFDTSQDEQRRQLERYGINPADGVMQSTLNKGALDKAKLITGGRNRARIASNDQNYNRMLSFINGGKSMQSGANNMVNAAYGGLSSALGNQASRANRNALVAQNNARQDWSDAAQGVGYLAQSYGKSWGAGSGS